MPRLLVVIAVLVAVAAMGCGGGSGKTTQGETRTGAPPSGTAFVALADTICANHRSRREDLESQARELGPIASRGQAARIALLLRKEAANRRSEVRELEALPTASADEAMAASVIPRIRAEAKVIDDWASAYAELDRRRIRRLQFQLAAITASTAGRARKHGFDVCGQS